MHKPKFLPPSKKSTRVQVEEKRASYERKWNFRAPLFSHLSQSSQINHLPRSEMVAEINRKLKWERLINKWNVMKWFSWALRFLDAYLIPPLDYWLSQTWLQWLLTTGFPRFIDSWHQDTLAFSLLTLTPDCETHFLLPYLWLLTPWPSEILTILNSNPQTINSWLPWLELPITLDFWLPDPLNSDFMNSWHSLTLTVRP